jgi:hypothetical protein
LRRVSAVRLGLAPRRNPRPNIGVHGDLDAAGCLAEAAGQVSVRVSHGEAEAIRTAGDVFQAGRVTRPDLTAVPAAHGNVPAEAITPEVEVFRHV